MALSMEPMQLRSLDESMKEHVQDGGAVTAILLKQVTTGGGAVVAGVDEEKPWFPVPVLADDREKIIECAGTKYTSAPMITALKQAERDGLDKVAFVGTPCQIHALRRRKNKVDALAIGLFCMETFDYNKLMANLREQGVESCKGHEVRDQERKVHRPQAPRGAVRGEN